MDTTIKLLPSVLYFLIGLISLIMAYKSLFALKFLPFHEEAAGKKWEDIDPKLQDLLLTLIKISGLGFLIIGLLLISFSIYFYLFPDDSLKYAIPIAALIFTCGLFLFNYRLYKKTNANTPWKRSILVISILIISIIISVFS